jgi:hypothetical protein
VLLLRIALVMESVTKDNVSVIPITIRLPAEYTVLLQLLAPIMDIATRMGFVSVNLDGQDLVVQLPSVTKTVDLMGTALHQILALVIQDGKDPLAHNN